MSFHIIASKKDISPTVIMPGDPKRAKYIGQNILQNVRVIENIRNNNIYTGYYNGILISIMSSGMGHSSLGIYVNELIKEYKVSNIIRLGTCGAINKKVKIGDIVPRFVFIRKLYNT